MNSRRAGVVLAAWALLVWAPRAGAEVVDAGAGGFTVRHTVTLQVAPDQVWQGLTGDFGKWWDPAHSFFGDASKFSLDATVGGAWIENAGNGRWVKHMEVVYADPGHLLRLKGGLGPLQAMAVTGVLTFSIEPTDRGVNLTMTYSVGGYNPAGLDSLAPVVDGVLGAQLGRLASYLE